MKRRKISPKTVIFIFKNIFFFLPLFILMFVPFNGCQIAFDEISISRNDRVLVLSLTNANDAAGKTAYYTVTRKDGDPSKLGDLVANGSFTIGEDGEITHDIPLARGKRSGNPLNEWMLLKDTTLVEIYLTVDMDDNYTNQYSANSNDLILRGKDILIERKTSVDIGRDELVRLDEEGTVRVRLTECEEAAGKRVIFQLVRNGGNPTNNRDILAVGEFELDEDGNGEALAYDANWWGNPTDEPIVFDGMSFVKIFMVVDMNDDYDHDPRANADDKILMGKLGLIYGTTTLEVQSEYLGVHIPGFTDAQFEILAQLAWDYNQGSGLTEQVEIAMEAVRNNPSLISRDDRRVEFLAQDASDTASALCTTISKYLYLHAVEILYPGTVVGLPETFWEYYLIMVNKGYVGENNARYCFAMAGPNMITDYLSEGVEYWEYDRNYTFTNDTQGLEMLYEKGPQIVMIRMGDNPRYSRHSFLAVLSTDGTYKMLDSGYRKWIGVPLEERFGPGNEGYLFILRSYFASEI